MKRAMSNTAPPAPAMARPTINAVDVGATPQIKEPTAELTQTQGKRRRYFQR